MGYTLKLLLPEREWNDNILKFRKVIIANIFKFVRKSVDQIRGYHITGLRWSGVHVIHISYRWGYYCNQKYIYLILSEWICVGCTCDQCPSHTNRAGGLRLLRYNDKETRWDDSDHRRLVNNGYQLEFDPVSTEDSGLYYCFINNRGLSINIHNSVKRFV